MEKVVNIQPLHSKKTDFHFWKDKPDAEKLAAIEMLRQQYIHFKFNNVQPRFQRVCRVINKAQKASGRKQDLGDIDNLQ